MAGGCAGASSSGVGAGAAAAAVASAFAMASFSRAWSTAFVPVVDSPFAESSSFSCATVGPLPDMTPRERMQFLSTSRPHRFSSVLPE